MCLSLNSCGVHGEARPHGAAPGEPINYRAVTLGRLGPVIDASCVAGEALSHAAKGKSCSHWSDGPLFQQLTVPPACVRCTNGLAEHWCGNKFQGKL